MEAAAKPGGYFSHSRPSPLSLPGVLNVHLVPHTHDDAGWLKTMDQYLYGLNQTIAIASVSAVLDSVVAALAADPARRFAYGEVAFFSRWWDDASEETRESVRRLVQEGRLEVSWGRRWGLGSERVAPPHPPTNHPHTPTLQFINGGWVQHDEAASHFEDMVAQTSRGHAWLARTLHTTPTVGWQIDPFGHSATHASLLTFDAGFDALFFGRSDYQDLARRATRGDLEVVWRADGAGRGRSGDVLAGAFASGNYGPPPGFNWDWAQGDDIIVDSTCTDVNNVAATVDAFVAAATALAATTRQAGEASAGGRDIMLTMGSDFQYAAARVWYRGLDALIHAANADGRVHALYSTPGRYARARADAAAGKGGRAAPPTPPTPPTPPLTFPLKTDDYFPYADCPSCYWTGYFTSRPALKKVVRDGGSLLAAVRALAGVDALREAVAVARERTTFTGRALAAVSVWRTTAPTLPPPTAPRAAWTAALDPLAEAAAIGMHHDAITGTARQHVTNDYVKRVAVGVAAVTPLVAGAIGDAALGALAPSAAPLRLCPAANATSCCISVAASKAGSPFVVLAHNPLARPRAARLRVPVWVGPSGGALRNTTLAVFDAASGDAVPSQIVPLSAGARRVRDSVAAADANVAATAGDATLAFVAELGPHASVAFLVEVVGWDDPAAAAVTTVVGRWGEKGAVRTPPPTPTPPSILLAPDPTDPSSAALELDGYTGEPAALISRGGARSALHLSSHTYNASDGSPTPDGRPSGSVSGAYIFRPHSKLAAGAPVVEVVRGPVVAEARFTWPHASVDVALWAGAPDAVAAWTAGPLPWDGVGREVVVEYATDLLESAGGGGDPTPPAILHTDSNGRRLLRRVQDARPSWSLNVAEPVAGNYYPVAALAVVRGDGGATPSSATSFAVAVDRGQGAASLRRGAIEFMLHRRLAVDDTRGVVEPLSETACGCRSCGCGGLAVAGHHVLAVASGDEAGAIAAREAALAASRPVVLVFGEGAAVAAARRANTRLATTPPPVASLPANVHLMSLDPVDGDGGAVMIRLAHLYGANECGSGGKDPPRSDGRTLITPPPSTACSPTTVDLSAIVPGILFDSVTETTVAGVRRLSEVRRARWPVDGEEASEENSAQPAFFECDSGCHSKPLAVTLEPLQVRTFVARVK